jgi:hypothetical protein
LVERLSTVAPAPSPNSTQVLRSFQLMMRESVSAADDQHRLGVARGHESLVHDHARRPSRCTPRHVEGRCARARPAPPATSTAADGSRLVGGRGGHDDHVKFPAAVTRRLHGDLRAASGARVT